MTNSINSSVQPQTIDAASGVQEAQKTTSIQAHLQPTTGLGSKFSKISSMGAHRATEHMPQTTVSNPISTMFNDIKITMGNDILPTIPSSLDVPTTPLSARAIKVM